MNTKALTNIGQGKDSLIKSTLAKLLAVENIHCRHVRGTDSPSFDVQNRVLRLPVWKNITQDLYDMLIVHEVGHALHTPAEDWIKCIKKKMEEYDDKDMQELVAQSIQRFVNVTEDIRIDKLQKRKYPGSKKNYVEGSKEIWDRGYFKHPDGKEIKDMTFIDRLNIATKVPSVYVPFHDEIEKKFYTRANNTETFDEAVQVAIDIWEYSMMEKHLADMLDEYKKNKDLANKALSEIMKDLRSMMKGFGGKSEQDENGEFSEGIDAGAAMRERLNGKPKPAQAKPKKAQKGQGEDGEGDEKGEGSGSGNKKGEEKDSEKGSGDDSDKKEAGKDESGDSEGQDKDGEVADGKGDDDQGDSNNGDMEGDDYGPSDSGEGEFGAKSKDDAGGAIPVNSAKDLPDTAGLDAYLKKMKGLVAKDSAKYIYSKIPYVENRPWIDAKVLHKKMMDGLSVDNNRARFNMARDDYFKFRALENATISFMVKEFEMKKRASMYSKSRQYKTGTLNTSKLHNYKFSEDLFRKNEVLPKGKNHGFVMFIDWSGSMSSNIFNTLCQLYSLIWFCRRIQAPFEVFSFTTPTHGDRDKTDFITSIFNKQDYNSEYYKLDTRARVHNIFSSRLTNNALMEMMIAFFAYAAGKYGYSPTNQGMGGTPLNETIVIAEKIVNEFRDKNKLDITNVVFLTDGEGVAPGIGFNSESITNAWNSRNDNLVYVSEDPKLHTEYRFENGNMSYDYTNAFLRNLKDRTGANLVGFYIHDGGHIDHILAQGLPIDKAVSQAKHKFFRDNGYVTIDNSGYDEYFLIKSTTLKLEQKEFDTKATSITTMTNQFMKHMDKKATSRLLLKNFIEKIA